MQEILKEDGLTYEQAFSDAELPPGCRAVVYRHSADR